MHSLPWANPFRQNRQVENFDGRFARFQNLVSPPLPSKHHHCLRNHLNPLVSENFTSKPSPELVTSSNRSKKRTGNSPGGIMSKGRIGIVLVCCLPMLVAAAQGQSKQKPGLW